MLKIFLLLFTFLSGAFVIKILAYLGIGIVVYTLLTGTVDGLLAAVNLSESVVGAFTYGILVKIGVVEGFKIYLAAIGAGYATVALFKPFKFFFNS